MKHHIIAFAILSVLTAPVLALAQDSFGSEVEDPVVAPTAAPTQYSHPTVSAPVTGAPATGVSGSNPPATGVSGTNINVGSGGNTVSTQGSNVSTRLENPLRGVNSIGDFIYIVINFVYSLSYAFIAFFLLWSGFKFIMAQGKPKELDDAKATFKYTIIGAILLIGANVITEVVRTVINRFVVTSI